MTVCLTVRPSRIVLMPSNHWITANDRRAINRGSGNRVASVVLDSDNDNSVRQGNARQDSSAEDSARIGVALIHYRLHNSAQLWKIPHGRRCQVPFSRRMLTRPGLTPSCNGNSCRSIDQSRTNKNAHLATFVHAAIEQTPSQTIDLVSNL
jgi:hypothetical protein